MQPGRGRAFAHRTAGCGNKNGKGGGAFALAGGGDESTAAAHGSQRRDPGLIGRHRNLDHAGVRRGPGDIPVADAFTSRRHQLGAQLKSVVQIQPQRPNRSESDRKDGVAQNRHLPRGIFDAATLKSLAAMAIGELQFIIERQAQPTGGAARLTVDRIDRLAHGNNAPRGRSHGRIEKVAPLKIHPRGGHSRQGDGGFDASGRSQSGNLPQQLPAREKRFPERKIRVRRRHVWRAAPHKKGIALLEKLVLIGPHDDAGRIRHLHNVGVGNGKAEIRETQPAADVIRVHRGQHLIGIDNETLVIDQRVADDQRMPQAGILRQVGKFLKVTRPSESIHGRQRGERGERWKTAPIVVRHETLANRVRRRSLPDGKSRRRGLGVSKGREQAGKKATQKHESPK